MEGHRSGLSYVRVVVWSSTRSSAIYIIDFAHEHDQNRRVESKLSWLGDSNVVVCDQINSNERFAL